ncbi:MAG TPA: hypothetical protein VLD36_24015, partial [Burkholderiales bacterium]|nr:hypothetical protein [Burkholderiales bacterium]
RLSIGGRPFRIIGTDGGLISSPITVTEVLLVPADRVDLVVGPFEEGATLRVESLPFRRGSIKKSKKPELFAMLKVGPSAPANGWVPESLRQIAPLVTQRATCSEMQAQTERSACGGGPRLSVRENGPSINNLPFR